MKLIITSFKDCILSFALVAILSFAVNAQQTKKVSLQGFLKDANGKAVADGQQNITFKLYTQEAGGVADWTEDQTINVFGGVYSTHLGKTVSLENLSWGTNTYFVGVTVQGTELTPRTELTFAPYSLGSPRATLADTARVVKCSGAVGDIKHSILNPTQFAAVNGSCWVPMDGRALATTDKLRQITNMTSLPNGGGLFIRSQEFSNSADYDPERNSGSNIAQIQNEALGSHSHSASLSLSGNTSYIGDHSHYFYIGKNSFQDGSGRQVAEHVGTESYNVSGDKSQIYTSGSGGHSHSLSGSANGNTSAAGGNETRPDNLNFWVYIRIN